MQATYQQKNSHIYSELRPRKSRGKTGCLACRSRRKKCDEQKPICRSCVRLHLTCSWTQETKSSLTRSEAADHGSYPAQHRPHLLSSSSRQDDPLDQNSRSTEYTVQAKASSESLLSELQHAMSGCYALNAQILHSEIVSDTRAYIQKSHGTEIALLFEHFCVRTAPWLINGHSHQDLVLRFVVPLVQYDELILKVVIAVSGVHLISSLPSVEPIVAEYYSNALRILRVRLSAWVNGSDLGYRSIFTAIIILCHHELIDGNTYGAAMHHLRACHEFVPIACEDIRNPDQRDLVTFLLEHYGYHLLMASLRYSPKKNIIVAALEFSDNVLPLIRSCPGFGSIFAFEPECLSLIPQIIALSSEKRQAGLTTVNHDRTETYVNLTSRLTNEWKPMIATYGLHSSEHQNIISIKVNTLLVLLHAAFYDAEEDRAHLMTLQQPLIDESISKLVDIEEADACFGLYWPILVTGSFVQNQSSRDLLIQKLRSNQSSMSCFTRGVELLQQTWERDRLNFGLQGLEMTASAHGVDVCIC